MTAQESLVIIFPQAKTQTATPTCLPFLAAESAEGDHLSAHSERVVLTDYNHEGAATFPTHPLGLVA